MMNKFPLLMSKFIIEINESEEGNPQLVKPTLNVKSCPFPINLLLLGRDFIFRRFYKL